MKEPIKCRGCGKIIQFVRTKNGKSMPVDGFSVFVQPYLRGMFYYRENGETVRGCLCDRTAPGAVEVYEPHWYTCTNRDEMKAQKKKTAKDYRAAAQKVRERAEKEREKEERLEAIRKRREEDRAAYIEARLAQQSMFSNRDEVYE